MRPDPRRLVLAAVLATLALPAAAHASPPANDAFSAAQTIPGATFSGTTVESTTQTDEPTNGFDKAQSVWYTWTPSSSGRYTIDLCGPGTSQPTNVSVYTGSAVNALTTVAPSSTAGQCDGSASSSATAATFTATASTTYKVRVAVAYSGATPAPFAGRIDPGPNTTAISTSIYTGERTSDGEDTVVGIVQGAESATFGCSVDGGTYAPCDDGLRLTGITGTTTIRVSATVDGQADPTPAVVKVTRDDAGAPDTQVTAFDPGVPSVTFGSTRAGVGLRCAFGGLPFSRCSSPAAFPQLCPAAFTLRVAVIDILGGLDPTPESRDVTGHGSACAAPTLQLSAPSFPYDDTQVNYMANSGGRPMSVRLEYGTTTAYGFEIALPDLVVSSTAVSRSVTIPHPTAQTLHVRVVGRTADGLQVTTPDQVVTDPSPRANASTITLGTPVASPTAITLPYTTTSSTPVPTASGFSGVSVRVQGEGLQRTGDTRPTRPGAQAGAFTIHGLTPSTTYVLQGTSYVADLASSDPVVVTTPAAPVPDPPATTTSTGQTPPPPPPPPKTPGRASASAGKLKADRKGRVKLTLTCPAGGGDCAGTVTLKQAKKTLAPARPYAITAGGRQVVTLTLTRKAKRALATAKKAKGLTATVTIGGAAKAVRLRR